MSKKIDLNWSVYDITKTYPEVIDIMANLGFDEIKKPAMLNSVGRIMTIPKGAKAKGISIPVVIAELIKNGFEITGNMPDISSMGSKQFQAKETGRNPCNIEDPREEVRLISADGEQLGIMSSRDAMKLAQEAELDLVKIAPGAKPPVCKIIDYGKYKYEQTRKEKEAKKKQKTVEIKEVRLSPNIDTNDLNTKVNNAKKFISKGNKVKVTLRFRGREMAHVQQSKHILDDFAKQLEDVATVEKAAKLEGRNMSMVLAEKR